MDTNSAVYQLKTLLQRQHRNNPDFVVVQTFADKYPKLIQVQCAVCNNKNNINNITRTLTRLLCNISMEIGLLCCCANFC